MALAPPVHRRPGYNRKAQYSLFAAYLLAVAGAFAALLLLIVSAVDPKGFSAFRSMADEVIAPAGRLLASARTTAGAGLGAVSAYVDAGRKNAALEKLVALQRAQLIKGSSLASENRRLRALLNLQGDSPEKVSVARLIGATGSSTRRTAILSAGLNRQIHSGMPVRAPEGLVGRVIEVGPTTARLLLLTDADTVVPVRRIQDDLPAFASGTGDGRLAIRPVTFGLNPFRRGDILVASGSGGIFWPGTPVAKVIARTRDGALAVPLANPAGADFVLVQRQFQPEATRHIAQSQGQP